MKISVSDNHVDYTPVQVGINQLARVICEKNYSLSTYRDNYRNIDNFLQTEAIGLDVDDSISIEDAIEKFKGYKCVIATTRNHRKEKFTKSGDSKGVADRFRVILFLDTPITDPLDYYETWYSLYEKFPFIDPMAKDPSRLFYPSVETVKVRVNGKGITPLKHVPKPVEEVKADTPNAEKGSLSRETLDFLLFGKAKESRHASLFKAAADAHEQGFTEGEFWELLKANVGLSELDLFIDGDRVKEAERTVKDAFSKEPRHKARLKESPFNLVSAGNIIAEKDNLEWIVEDLLTKGGTSLIAGDPKAGKSTLWRQLSRSVARGEEFLGRKAKQGSVVYLALEEQKEMLGTVLYRSGITEADPIHFHVGGIRTKDLVGDLRELLLELKPSLCVVDTMVRAIGQVDLNSYNQVYEALGPFVDLARETECHISFVHHTNKGGMGMNSISGSKALAGALDNALLFQVEGQSRLITTIQRGGTPFNRRELIFNCGTESYEIGEHKVEDEF